MGEGGLSSTGTGPLAMDRDAVLQEYSRCKDWNAAYTRLRLAADEQEARLKLRSKEARSVTNRFKNRYRDVLPYDDSRVRLCRSEDYINASLVPIPEANRKYILCQGTRAIVMLNRLVEKNQEKCHSYFPTSEDRILEFSDEFRVELVSEEEDEHFTIRTISLEKLKDMEDGQQDKREIVHFQFTTWPDFGVPQDCSHLLEYLEKIRESELLDSRKYGSPVIHCSAGIGRSGTFIIVDSSLNLMSSSASGEGHRLVDINGLALDLRRYRMGLIQTREQLQFTWRTVVTALQDPRWEKLVCGEGGEPKTPPILEREMGNQLASGASSLSVDYSESESPAISGTRKRTFTGCNSGEGDGKEEEDELSSPSPLKCASSGALLSSSPKSSNPNNDARERMRAKVASIKQGMAESERRRGLGRGGRWWEDYGLFALGLAATAAALFAAYHFS